MYFAVVDIGAILVSLLLKINYPTPRHQLKLPLHTHCVSQCRLTCVIRQRLMTGKQSDPIPYYFKDVFQILPPPPGFDNRQMANNSSTNRIRQVMVVARRFESIIRKKRLSSVRRAPVVEWENGAREACNRQLLQPRRRSRKKRDAHYFTHHNIDPITDCLP